jgi:predicted alpha/beta hydrolase family esterase
MKNALILHSAGNNSKGNWFPWLQKELEQKGYDVWLPDLPNPDFPNAEVWKEFIFSRKDWQFSKESLIIGHSSGATFILSLLEALPRTIQIEKAIFVAPFIELGPREDVHPYKKGLLKGFDWKKMQHSAKRFYFIASDNDPYFCGEDQSRILQDRLGGEVVLVPGEGHFNLDNGEKYKQFPLLLQYI